MRVVDLVRVASARYLLKLFFAASKLSELSAELLEARTAVLVAIVPASNARRYEGKSTGWI